jgi:hypothetical protein
MAKGRGAGVMTEAEKINKEHPHQNHLRINQDLENKKEKEIVTVKEKR